MLSESGNKYIFNTDKPTICPGLSYEDGILHIESENIEKSMEMA